MSLKSRINKLYALKSMLIQAREQAKMKNILNVLIVIRRLKKMQNFANIVELQLKIL